jgi:hypothetical protein
MRCSSDQVHLNIYACTGEHIYIYIPYELVLSFYIQYDIMWGFTTNAKLLLLSISNVLVIQGQEALNVP